MLSFEILGDQEELRVMSERKSIEVVAAVIYWNGKTLCVQRGESKLDYISKKWEFPGGKVEIGESLSDALKREILEELNLEIDVQGTLTTVHHSYPDFDLTMHALECSIESEMEPSVVRTEHLDHQWLVVGTAEFESLDWAAADVPIVEVLAVPS